MEENKNNIKKILGLDKKTAKSNSEKNVNNNEEKKDKNKSFIKTVGPSNLVIILMVGVLLLIISWPTNTKESSNDKKTKEEEQISVNENPTREISTKAGQTEFYVRTLEERLENALRKVEGVGQVEVMITLKGSKEVIVLKDEPYTQSRVNEADGNGGKRITSSHNQEENTIMIENQDGSKTPYVLKELEPQVEGILIISEGGDNVSIINQIIEATQVLFGVQAHKVKVMKMN